MSTETTCTVKLDLYYVMTNLYTHCQVNISRTTEKISENRVYGQQVD